MNYNEIPTLITAWNRPEKIDALIRSLKIIKPKKLYFSCDGPKNKSSYELIKIEKTRKIINENIDWDCSLEKKFNKDNLGCRFNMINSINWIFEKNETAIILEDDCIPNPDFFKFCFYLLKRHKNDKDIWNINGTNLQNGIKRGNSSYYFSRYFHSWGWATWRDRWNKIDDELKNYEVFKNSNNLDNFFLNKSEKKYWINIWDNLKYHNKPDSWAYRWLYTCISNRGLSITPNINLINNIGFDNEATNTKILINNKTGINNIKIFDDFGILKHPYVKEININADIYTFKNSFKISFKRKISILFTNPYYYLRKFFKLIFFIF